jgi:hypothetical protein
MRRILPILWASCAWAQSGLEVPDIGAFADSSGFLRPVQGVAGNFLLGPAMMSGVLSAACSERVCLAKTDSKIISLTGEVEAPPGPAVFGVDRSEAVIFFPESRAFARWHNNTLEPLDWTVAGEVLSILLADGQVQIAVRREGDGNGPALLLPEGVVFAAEELVLRRRDGTELHFELAGAETIARMGEHYAAIRAGSTTYALRIDSGHEQLYLLPGNAP